MLVEHHQRTVWEQCPGSCDTVWVLWVHRQSLGQSLCALSLRKWVPCVSVCLSVCLSVCACVCVSEWVRVCVCVCVCVRVYVHTYQRVYVIMSAYVCPCLPSRGIAVDLQMNVWLLICLKFSGHIIHRNIHMGIYLGTWRMCSVYMYIQSISVDSGDGLPTWLLLQKWSHMCRWVVQCWQLIATYTHRGLWPVYCCLGVSISVSMGRYFEGCRLYCFKGDFLPWGISGHFPWGRPAETVTL